MKKISGKRNKTESDLKQLSKIEFQAGLYLFNNVPVLPTKMFRATFIKGAMKDKNGPVAKPGVFFLEHSPIEYEGPKNPKKMYEIDEFVFRCPVKVNQSSIVRTRPVFSKWSVTVPFEYEETIIDKDTILLAWKKAGQLVGVGDWRPEKGGTHGRFIVEEVK